MSLETVQVHRLSCDFCPNSIEDLGENRYSKDMRNWAKEIGWKTHHGKDYCPECEEKEESKNV